MAKSSRSNRAPRSYAAAPGDAAAPTSPDSAPDSTSLSQIAALLAAHCPFNLTYYDQKLLASRVTRRMQQLGFSDQAEYLELLLERPDERERLARQLFEPHARLFRGTADYNCLAARVIPALFRPGIAQPIRLWIPACGFGADAYSLAILLLEFSAASAESREFRLLATESSDELLAAARQGVFSAGELAAVSPSRLARFFQKLSDNHFEVNRQLRAAVSFGRHDLLTDTCLSHMDLIACRGLLSSLVPSTRDRLLDLLHYALNPGGVLFLGPTGDLGVGHDLFEKISPVAKLYRRKTRTRTDIPPLTAGEPAVDPPAASPPERSAKRDYGALASQVPLPEGAAVVLVRPNFEIVHFLGPTIAYLQHPPGVPTRDLLRMARDGLRAPLRRLARAALDSQVCQSSPAVPMQRAGRVQLVTLSAHPLRARGTREDFVLFVFLDAASDASSTASGHNAPPGEEVIALRRDLDASVAETEELHRGLDAAHAQIDALNEELISLNDEWLVSQDELELLNQRCDALHAERIETESGLRQRLGDLERAGDDFANLLNSTHIAVLFLDESLRIRRLTPAAAKLLNLRPADVDRLFADIRHGLVTAEVVADAERVLHDLTLRERELSAPGDEWYVCRVLPYCTFDKIIAGVSVTWWDVTLLKRAELSLRQDKELHRLAAVLRDSSDAVILRDLAGHILSWNRGAARLYDYTEEEALRMNVSALVPDICRDDEARLLARLAAGESVQSWETQRRTRSGALLDVSLTATPFKDERGVTLAVSTTEQDITERKHAERRLLEVAWEEQRRIGQELHDGTSQVLTGLCLMAKSLALRLEAEAHGQGRLAQEIFAGLQRTLREVRDLSHGLVPVELDAEGLRGALLQLVDRIQEVDGIQCTLEFDEALRLRDHHVATQLYHIVQEATTNALKHARTRRIEIRFKVEGGQTIAQVVDDGVGIPQSLTGQTTLGLRGMRYRAGLIQAVLHIDSAPGRGTCVTCILPSGSARPVFDAEAPPTASLGGANLSARGSE